jgi:circadian clock protein KaiB
MKQYVLRLFVNGRTSRSLRAIENLRSICERELAGRYDLSIVDVLERPEVAEEEKILATPVLVREVPPPRRRIIGDLSDRDRVLEGLDLFQPTGRTWEGSNE